MHTLLSNTFKTLEELIQPKYCTFCMSRITTENNSVICQRCRVNIKRESLSSCNRYSKINRDLSEDYLCKDTIENKLNIYYPFKYKGLIRDGLQRFKYKRELNLLNYFSEELYLFFKTEVLKFEHIDFISYVPLHHKKLRERGFNQAKLLAERLSKRSSIRLLKRLLYRTVYTPSQSKLSKEERRLNINGVFKVNLKYKNLIRDSKVLLIDDIITTGSTATECAKELRKLKASAIVLAIAGG